MREDHAPLELSVIVLSYNHRIALQDCLESLKANLLAKIPVFIVDNCSWDGSAELVINFYPAFELFPMHENMGFAKANNAAIGRVQTPWVLLLNNDTIVPAGFFQQLGSFVPQWPNLGVLGMRHQDLEGHVQLTMGRFPSLAAELGRQVLNAVGRISRSALDKVLSMIYRGPTHVDWVSGSCMLIRKEAWEKVGGFDENIFLYYEDIDFCRRVRAAGYEVMYHPGISIRHRGGASTKRFPGLSERAYRSSQIYFFRKHYGRVADILVRTYVALRRMPLSRKN